MQRFSFEAPNPPIPYYSTPRTNGAAHSGIDREIFSACHPHTLRTAPLACILKQCAHDKGCLAAGNIFLTCPLFKSILYRVKSMQDDHGALGSPFLPRVYSHHLTCCSPFTFCLFIICLFFFSASSTFHLLVSLPVSRSCQDS